MEEERDIVVFADEDGNQIEMDVIDYFEHNGQEYAVLMDIESAGDHEHDEECDCEQDVYIMKIITRDDMEEFVPVEEEMLDELIPIVEQRLFAEDEEDDDEKK